MKKISIVFTLLLVGFSLQAQTADEIINKYLENIGGADKLRSLTGIKVLAKVNESLHDNMPLIVTNINMKDGRELYSVGFQGKTVVHNAFDGETVWKHHFLTMKAERKDNEITLNTKREIGSFPDPFLDYSTKGYKVELMGKETVEGSECFKIKLTQNPLFVDGKETENTSFYFFDTESYVPLLMEKEHKYGISKNYIMQYYFSDYQEVGGIYFPFSTKEQYKGGEGDAIITTQIELNPVLDPSVFAFPQGK